VVERILGKAEVVSSILTGSTIFPPQVWLPPHPTARSVLALTLDSSPRRP
jgi:hypothetical protein